MFTIYFASIIRNLSPTEVKSQTRELSALHGRHTHRCAHTMILKRKKEKMRFNNSKNVSVFSIYGIYENTTKLHLYIFMYKIVRNRWTYSKCTQNCIILTYRFNIPKMYLHSWEKLYNISLTIRFKTNYLKYRIFSIYQEYMISCEKI